MATQYLRPTCRMMKWYPIFLLILCPFAAHTQHIAPATDNYNTAHAMLYNPASAADPIPFANIRVFGISALLQNSYLYFPDGKVGGRFGTKEASAGSNQHFFLETDIYGPAITFAREYFSFGFFTRVRANLLCRNITPEIVNFAINGLNHPPQHFKDYTIENGSIKHLGWGEIGINYAQIIKRTGDQIITLGGNLKILSAFSQMSVRFNEMNYMVDTMDITVRSTHSQWGLSIPQANLGLGAGIDFGIQLKKLLTDDNDFHIPHSVKRRCEVKEYKYKLGLSLIDLGFIPIRKNTTTFGFEGDSLFMADYENNKFSSLTSFINIIEQMYERTGANPEIKNKVTAFLPLTIGAQFDYYFKHGLFANATMMAGIRMPWLYGAERMSALTLTGRWEKRRLCLAIPVSLYRYGPPTLGFYMRLGPMQLGCNRPLPFVLRRDAFGADAYASLTFSLHQSRPCREFNSKKAKYCPPGKKSKKVIIKAIKKYRDKRKKEKELEKNENL